MVEAHWMSFWAGKAWDMSPALQAAIDGAGPGIIKLPPGNYQVGKTINVPANVTLEGHGYNATMITAMGDFTVFNFTGGHGGLRDMWVVGQQTANATANAVVIGNNLPVYLYDCRIWGGKWALENNGVDGSIRDCFIMGSATAGGGVISRGANWYDRCKLDSIAAGVVSAAFRQDAPFQGASSAENHFVQSDFSGTFTDSILIADSTNAALTAFVNCVISSPTRITGGRQTRFVSCEFGANISSAAAISVVGCIGVGGAFKVSGAGVKALAGNQGIS